MAFAACALAEPIEEARRLKQDGQFAAAAKAYEAALPALREGRDSNLLAHALLEAAQVQLSSGDYARASQRATEAAGMFRRANDGASGALAENAAGNAHVYSGEYADAISSFERALELDRQQHDAKGEITRLSNLGNVYFFQGKYLDALDRYEQAWRRVEETASEPWNTGRRQLVLSNLAILYEQLGQNQKALSYYQQAMATPADMPPTEYAQLLSNVGTLYRRLGDAVKALENYRAAQNLFSRAHLSDPEIHVLQNIGIAQALEFNDLGSAVKSFSEALALAQATSNRRETALARLFRGEALYRLAHWKDAGEDFQGALDGARALGAIEEQWTALYGMGRIAQRQGDSAGALRTYREAIEIIESVRSRLGNSSLKTEFLANKRDVYDAAIDLTLAVPARDTAQLFGMFEEARSRNLQDALRGTKPALAAVQSKLASGSMLLEYWMGANRFAALWITRDAAGVAARDWTRDDAARMGAFGATLRAAEDASWRDPAAQLGAALLAGIPLGSHVKQLMIVPDGPLAAIPFELLSTAPGAPLVTERFAVSYLPSAALLLKDPAWRTPLPPWRRQLAAFGDPVVTQAAALPEDQHWQPLPDSARELRAIARMLPGSAAVHAGAADQKRRLFDGGIAGVPLLHFSTHAAVDTADPNRSRILFTPEPGRRGSEYLFRGEVQSLPLAGTDLVTLSACDTEGGRLTRGEGVQSFSRAFLAAGARSTVTTLWRVADGPTADFMQQFYHRLARGDSKAEALRAAKLTFLRSGTALALPKYWAAFVLNGDGQATVRPVISWLWVIVAGLALAFAAILVFRYRFRRQ